jgi:hypothetical protein
MSALPHEDDWTEVDERALRRLPEVQELAMRTNDEISAWSAEVHGTDKADYWWGQEHPPWEPGHVPPPQTFEERLQSIREDVRVVRSDIVPFEEPLLYALDSRVESAGLDLPSGVEPVGPRHRLCLMIYGFDLKPAEDEAITSVEPRLTYLRPKGLTYSMVPNSLLEERFHAKTRVALSIAGRTSAGIPGITVDPLVEAHAHGAAEAESVVSWQWEYRLLRATVETAGRQSSFAEWKISKKGLIGPLEVRVIIRLPRQARHLSLEVGGAYRVKKRRTGWKRERPARVFATKVRGEIVLGS